MTTYLGLKTIVTTKPLVSFKKAGNVETVNIGTPYFFKGISAGKTISQKLRLGLADMKKLKNDWDTYGAKAPSEETINKAYAVLDVIPFLKAPEIFPEKDGSIGLYWDEPTITRIITINSSTYPLVQYKEEKGDDESTFTYRLDEILHYICGLNSSKL